ncbi:MAG: putative RNA-binding protein, contains TRAM domain protein [halophilic archaeon J07HX5]|jgi:Predicted RNA-binding protein, contains TRAM domain|nr:MAG: putative RNA-binding protein, contains TRAM domain protein [halophilic archaeon J07HX5]
MQISDELVCLYTAEVGATDDTHTIDVPQREIEQGTIAEGEQYRIAILTADTPDTTTHDQTDPTRSQHRATEQQQPAPPVTEGEIREVEIESLGDQGDGIAKVDRGFVLIVPDTEIGERVTVEIGDVGSNVAFAAVVDRHHEV